MKNMFVSLLLLTVFAVCGAYVLISVSGGIGKLFKKQPINPKKAIATFAVLVLAVATAIPGILLFPTANDGERITSFEGSYGLTEDTPDIQMNGSRTRSDLDAFLKEGFGDSYSEIWNGTSAENFMFSHDQEKIKTNEAYLQTLLNDKKLTGFRNAVDYPSAVLTPEVVKNVVAGKLTAEELEDVYNQHRWLDIYRLILTNPAYCEMVLQGLEEYPEFVEQNASWHPEFRQLLDWAKASEDGVYSLWVEEDNGSGHWSDDYRYGAARVCAVYENAIIRGIAMDQMTLANWELPSMSPEVNTRWTVKLVEKDDQENKPSAIWSFPNTKSGNDAYNDGFNVADLRLVKYEPKKTVPVNNKPTDPGTTPPPGENPPPAVVTPSHKVYTYYREYGTNTDIAQSTSQTITEGKSWKTSAKENITGYTYYNNSTGSTDKTVSGTMGKSDVTVVFYYKPTSTKTVNVNLTVRHVDANTGKALPYSEQVISVLKDSQQTARSSSFVDYTFAGYYTVDGGSKTNGSSVTLTMSSDKTVTFYYVREWKLTTRFVEEGTGAELDNPAYDYYPAGEQFTATARDITGYTLVRNSETGSSQKIVKGPMPSSEKTVTFYYKKVVQTHTVTAYYRAIDSNHNLTDPVRQTVEVGKPYSTQQLSFDGYKFVDVKGDPASSDKMPDRDVTVTYLYELVHQDGNNNKDPNSDPTKNDTGNGTEGKGPDDTNKLETWQPEDPDTGERVPEQSEKGEQTSNQNTNKNPAAGSDERQEVSNDPVSATDENKEGNSSGTGGQDHQVVGPGNTQNGTPPDKTTPDKVTNDTWTSTTTGNSVTYGGDSGNSGSSGSSGSNGSSGSSGSSGSTGSTGSTGDTGNSGSSGGSGNNTVTIGPPA